MAQNVIATVEELRDATDWSLDNPDGKSFHEKNTEWLKWFDKRGSRILKDATLLGRYSATVDVPYQPSTSEAEKGLVELRKKLRPMLPGCSVHFIEEVYEGVTICTILIGWQRGAS